MIVSALVAVTIVPLAARTWLQRESLKDRNEKLWRRISALIMSITRTARRRWTIIAGMVSLPLVLSVILLPELDYLPPVKRDAVDAYFWFPPGAGEHTIASEYLQVLDDRMAPFMSGERQPALQR